MMSRQAPLAAIDVGTSSIHMVIARHVVGGSPDVLARERIQVRLGHGGADMKYLAPDAIDRAVAALAEYRQIADGHGAEVVAVATSAVREAANQADFVRRARQEAGVEVEVVSGVEEARLIHLGALSEAPVAGRPHVVIDIGGGSTELIVATDTDPVLARSLKLGHIRLTDGFFPGGVVIPEAVEACRRHIKSFVAPEARAARAIGFEVAVGCSGTIATLAAMCAARHRAPLRTVANATIERAELDSVVADLVARPRPEDRARVPGLEAGRRDVIVAGAVLLSQLFDDLGIRSLVVSTGALREGVLLDRYNRRRETPSDGLHHLGDLRLNSVLALARDYHEDLVHAEHATDLALELFDETQHLHGLGAVDSELLEAAGLLHNIGRFVAYSAHHKHSYYLIRHSERLAGFTEGQLELIALVARYHRKSEPRKSHPEFMALRLDERRRVRVMAGLLRVGIALDRTYRRAVERVSASVTDDALMVDLEVAEGISVEIERFSARSRAGLLADALGRSVDFRVVAASGPTGGRAAAAQRHPARGGGFDARPEYESPPPQ